MAKEPTLRQHLRSIARKGGLATAQRGSAYFRKIGAKGNRAQGKKPKKI